MDPLDPAPNMEHTFCTSFLVMCLLTVSCVSADLYSPVIVNPHCITVKHRMSMSSWKDTQARPHSRGDGVFEAGC